MHAKERLYLTKDRTKVVKEGHPDSGSLLASVGKVVPKEYEHLVKRDGTAHGKPIEKAPRLEPAISAHKAKEMEKERNGGELSRKEGKELEDKEVKDPEVTKKKTKDPDKGSGADPGEEVDPGADDAETEQDPSADAETAGDPGEDETGSGVQVHRAKQT